MDRFIVAVLITMSAVQAFAATDCRVIEYPDHDEAVCIGDEKAGPVASQSTKEKAQPAAQVQTDTDFGPRPGRVSRSRLDVSINARNKLLQQLISSEKEKERP